MGPEVSSRKKLRAMDLSTTSNGFFDARLRLYRHEWVARRTTATTPSNFKVNLHPHKMHLRVNITLKQYETSAEASYGDDRRAAFNNDSRCSRPPSASLDNDRRRPRSRGSREL